MVKITITSGEWAGRSRELTLSQVDPMELFQSFLQHGDGWQVDYSQATEEERFHFFRAELIARIMRALEEGRPIFFLEKKWQMKSDSSPIALAGEIEDAIANSSRMITLGKDDEKGLVIEAAGYEI